MKKYFYYLVPLIYLVISFATLSDYGLNWDNAKHYRKGQAYLNYILHGEETYVNLPGYPTLNPEAVSPATTYEEMLWLNWEGSKRSFYQADGAAYIDMLEGLDGYSHPAGNDLSAAISNYIFYQKLGILGDYEAHNLFIILISFISVLFVSYFAYKEFGTVASLLSGFFYGFYPLFFAESHFNIKDPVITAYISLTIITFYYSVKRKSFEFLIASSVLAGLGLSTKLNIVFAPVILLPWLVIYLIKQCKFIRKHLKYYFAFLGVPIMAFCVFVLTWPYLWHNILAGIAEMLMYYLDIGKGGNNLVYEPYIFSGINFYPLYFILLTTPLPMLILFILGIAYSARQFTKNKKEVYLLLLAWFLVPVLRVSTPSATIYGGVRQIMEYVPAMALLAGVAGQAIYNKIKAKNISRFVLSMVIIIMAWEMITIHPNQNVYFNQLAGGLKGAAEKTVPYWGNSFGNAYLQGIEWLNEYAEPNARVAPVLFSDHELPFQKLRSDISLSNSHWSGAELKGEYIMELYLDGDATQKYKYQYAETYLNPVYELKAQNQAILKIWKNDTKHLKIDLTKYRLLDFEIKVENSEKTGGNYLLTLDLLTPKHVGGIIWTKPPGCEIKYRDNIVYTSLDGKNWQRQPDFFGEEKSGKISVYLPHVYTKYIRLDLNKKNACLLSSLKIEVWGLD